MKLLIDKEEAIKLLRERISDINSWDFDAKVWKDRTILDVKQIFGQTGEQWLQVSSLKFETFVDSQKAQVLKEGKETAKKLLNSYIDYIEKYTVIAEKKRIVEEDSFRQKYRELLAEWNEFVPQYNELLKEHKTIVDYNQSLEAKLKELETQISDEKLGEEYFPFELVSDSRGYLENVAKQAIMCYQNGLFDGCLVMTRKLLETLIIECFEKHDLSEEIKNSEGNFYFLSDLISKLLKQTKWTVGRNSQQSLPRIKKFADLSAHNRRFNAKKSDLDGIKDDVRIVIEELIHIAELKK
jgi:hypothetical protein